MSKYEDFKAQTTGKGYDIDGFMGRSAGTATPNTACFWGFLSRTANRRDMSSRSGKNGRKTACLKAGMR